MTTPEFIELGNKLSALHVDLMNNKNADLWIAFRNVRNKGHLMDVSLFFYNDNTSIEYRYKFYQIDSLSEAKRKLEYLYKVIQTLG